jgi:hypothetical protein
MATSEDLLAMTNQNGLERAPPKDTSHPSIPAPPYRHCEERSDAAVHSLVTRFATPKEVRNKGLHPTKLFD